ncbi:hypothetical protein BDN71DRAFT_1513640 [Pleurotus eryngii]|uniref:Uncharacterized protein n=1 Tax=Pleurotus eryngii TaxID=5323 RepID=A0A9P6D1S0_PLEER|nr:hypothetical protein BDN71DRAFT_1513640 [Pleurotus eryngii]
MHESTFKDFAIKTLEKNLLDRMTLPSNHLVPIMLAELEGANTSPAAPPISRPSSISQNAGGLRMASFEDDDDDDDEEEEEEEEEESSSDSECSMQRHHSSGVRPPVLVHVKIEGLSSSPVGKQPKNKPSASQTLLPSIPAVNSTMTCHHYSVDWKVVTHNTTTKKKRLRIRYIILYCKDFAKVKDLISLNVLVPSVWTVLSGDTLLLYNVPSLKAVKGADLCRIWFFKCRWRDITVQWNEGLDAAHIAHPDKTSIFDRFLTQSREQLNDHLMDKKAERQAATLSFGCLNVLNRNGTKIESMRHANDVLEAAMAKVDSVQQDACAHQEVHAHATDNEAALKDMQQKNNKLLNEGPVKLQKLRSTVANLEKKCKENIKHNAYIDSKVSAQDEELLKYDKKIEEAWNAQNEAMKEAARLRKTLEKEETERQLAENKVKSLEETLKDSASKIRDSKSLLATRVREAAVLSDDIASLRDELRVAKETIGLLDHPVEVVNINKLGGEWATTDTSMTTIPQVQQGTPNVIEDEVPGVGRLSNGKLRRPPKSSLPTHSQPVHIPTAAEIENSKTTVERLKKMIGDMGGVTPSKILKAELVKQAKELARMKRGEAEPQPEPAMAE